MSRTSRSSVLTAGLLSYPPVTSSQHPGAAAAGGGGGPPRGQFVQSLAHLDGPGGQLLPAEGGQAHPVVWIDLTVPLIHPRLKLGQPCHQRDQLVVRPAV